MTDRLLLAVLFGGVVSAVAWSSRAPLFWTVAAGLLAAGLTWLLLHLLRNRR